MSSEGKASNGGGLDVAIVELRGALQLALGETGARLGEKVRKRLSGLHVGDVVPAAMVVAIQGRRDRLSTKVLGRV